MLSLSIKLPIKNFSIKGSKTIGNDPERQLLLVFDNPGLDRGFFLWVMEKNPIILFSSISIIRQQSSCNLREWDGRKGLPLEHWQKSHLQYKSKTDWGGCTIWNTYEGRGWEALLM